MRSLLLLLVSVLLLGLPACDADASGSRLVLTGSSTVAPLAAEIGRRFEQDRPGVRVDVQTGGSGRGIADARAGFADFGMVSRALAEDESDLRAWAIAMDGVCPIVHRDNPVTELSDAQVVAIYTGAVERWSDAGGADAPITVVHKAEGRATLEVFLAHFGLRNPAVRPDVVVGDNQHAVKTVAGDPHAIGYVSIGAAEAAVGDGVPIRLLPVGGLEPTAARVADGSFPLVRGLHLVRRDEPDGLAAAFLAYARSERVRDLVEGLGLVPVVAR